MKKQYLQQIIPLVVFAVLAFAYLAITAQDLFYVVQSQDFFVYDSHFFDRVATYPGWVAPYVGSFLTQFAFHPLAGIGLFVLLLTALAWIAQAVWRVPRQLSALTLVPSVLVVAFVVGWDYGLFGTRHYGNLFSPIVGMMLATLLTAVSVRLKNRWIRYAWSMAVLVLLYPFLGFYALMATVMPLMLRLDKLIILLTLVPMAFVPYIEAQWLFPNFNSHFCMIAGLPFKDYFKTQLTWMPLYVAFAFSLMLPLLARAAGKMKPRMATVISCAVAAAAVALVPMLRFNDSNFKTLLAVEHAYGTGEDNRVLELCTTQQQPIRSIVMYRNIELWKRGELLDKMFQYSWDTDTVKSVNLRMNTYITGAKVFQHYTFWNFSYRWAMERMVMYKPSYADIQIMARNVLYNHETELADKYLSMLDNTLYYKDWAHTQRRLLSPETLRADSAYMMHRQIVLVPQGAIDNTEYCEYLLLKYFTNLYALTPKRAELCLAACMIMHKENEFWQIVLAQEKANPGMTLPRHVQEAALLYALKKNNASLMAQIKLMVGPQGAVCQQFERNQDLLARLLTAPTMIDVNTLAALCPGTYWNYYFNDSRKGVVFD